jgi:hypothetical protein
VALGASGDRRATEPLLEQLASARFSSMRDAAARGLGLLGDARAIGPLVTASAEPGLPSAPEALVRLRAIRRRAIGGADVGRSLSARDGWESCADQPPDGDDGFAHRTRCTTNAASARLTVSIPSVCTERGAWLIVGARRADSDRSVAITIRIGDYETRALAVDGQWSDLRVNVPAGALAAGRASAQIRVGDEAARLWVDHLLLVPR